MERAYELVHFEADPSHMHMTLDASPWGVGAVLTVNGVPKEYFFDEVSSDDRRILRVTVGDAASQQVLESLTAVIALRLWWPWWSRTRASVAIRGDNMTLLSMITDLKGKSTGLNILAREAGLLLAAAHYRPLQGIHIPGVSNVVADKLSRNQGPRRGSCPRF